MDEKINLNTASIEELTTLPGIGPALAKRISAQRPFESLDELRKVRGVGPAFLDRLQPLVTLERELFEADVETLVPKGEAEPETGFILVEETESREPDDALPGWEDVEETAASPEAESEPPDDETTIPTEKAIVPVEEKSKRGKPPQKEKTFSRGAVFMIAALSSLMAFLLAVIVSLGTITIINGGLRYASAPQVDAFTRQVEGLSLQTEILSSELTSFESRLATLDSDVETLRSALDTEVGSLTTEIESLNDDLDDLNTEIDDLEESSQFFQEFLDGLRELLDSLPTP